MSSKLRIYLVAGAIGASLLPLAACGHKGDSDSSPPATSSITAPSEPALIAEEYTEGEATVVAVNQPARSVTLSNARGQVTTVKVPADVDLTRLKVGDTVLIGILQSLSAQVLPPGSALLGTTVATGSTPPGQPSGRAWGQQVTIVAEVTAIDLTTHTVTLRGGDGETHTIAVKDPQTQQRMTNLKIGDLVQLSYSEALAARVVPKTRN